MHLRRWTDHSCATAPTNEEDTFMPSLLCRAPLHSLFCGTTLSHPLWQHATIYVKRGRKKIATYQPLSRLMQPFPILREKGQECPTYKLLCMQEPVYGLVLYKRLTNQRPILHVQALILSVPMATVNRRAGGHDLNATAAPIGILSDT